VQPDGDVHGAGDCVDRSPALRVANAFGCIERLPVGTNIAFDPLAAVLRPKVI
jgi:hypothetical protein